MAMTGVLRPGHGAIRVLDLDEAVHHYRDIMGLVETGRDAQGRVYLKCWDERDHNSVVLRQADRAGIDFFGFKVRDKATLNQLEADLRACDHRCGATATVSNLATDENACCGADQGADVDRKSVV